MPQACVVCAARTISCSHVRAWGPLLSFPQPPASRFFCSVFRPVVPMRTCCPSSLPKHKEQPSHLSKPGGAGPLSHGHCACPLPGQHAPKPLVGGSACPSPHLSNGDNVYGTLWMEGDGAWTPLSTRLAYKLQVSLSLLRNTEARTWLSCSWTWGLP